MLKLDGIMTALVTPLNSDGTVDEQTLTALIIDDSGLKQYNNLKEKGYFNTILASLSLIHI